MCLSHLVLCHSLLSHFIPKHQQQEESKEQEGPQPAEGRWQEQRAPGWSSSQLLWRLFPVGKVLWEHSFHEDQAVTGDRRMLVPKPKQETQKAAILYQTEIVFQSGLVPEYGCGCVWERERVHMCMSSVCTCTHSTQFCLVSAKSTTTNCKQTAFLFIPQTSCFQGCTSGK